jgi:hypothetical protein
VSIAEGKEFAEAAELLSAAEGEKIITVEGKKVKIKKITVGELADILKVAKDSELEQYIWLVYKCLVEPKLTVDQVRRLKHTTLLLLAWEIQKFSELDRESIQRLENFFKTKS